MLASSRVTASGRITDDQNRTRFHVDTLDLEVQCFAHPGRLYAIVASYANLNFEKHLIFVFLWLQLG